MCLKRTVLLLSVAVAFAVIRQEKKLCDGISSCYCEESATSFHLNCSALDVSIRQEKYKSFLSIYCKENEVWTYDKIPKLPLGNMYGIKLVTCPILANDSVVHVLEHFGIEFKDLAVLSLHNNGIDELSKIVFHRLLNLTELDLSENKISFLPENVFESLEELLTLKLSGNKLKSLEEGTFRYQTKLETLDLDHNNLVYLTKETFTGLSSLKDLRLHKNNFTRLSRMVFHNLPNLRSIYLGNTDVKCEIPDDIFTGNNYLIDVHLERVKVTKQSLTNFRISKLSIMESEFEHLFALPRNITKLNLSYNQLTNLYDGLFDGQEQLSTLQLSYNNLSTISKQIFQRLQNLQNLYLDNNRLVTIHPDAFVKTNNLSLIDLSNNQLSFKDIRPPFKYLVNLQKLNLSNNNLISIPSDLKNMKELIKLDLAFNKITSLKYNELSCKLPYIAIHPEPPKFDVLHSSLLQVFLNDNPLECDCSMTELSSRRHYYPDAILKAIAFSCPTDPPDECLNHYFDFINCNDDMTEYSRIRNGRLLVMCSFRDLKTVPEIPLLENLTILLDLYINNNIITELPKLQNNLHVAVIEASNNRIYEIKEEHLPPNLRVLDVSHNQIKTISANVYEALGNHKTLEILFLADNPWSCECTTDTKSLIKFLKRNISITDLYAVTCQGPSNVDLKFISDTFSEALEDICFKNDLQFALVGIAILGILIGILGILFFKYQQLLRVWLYAHYGCFGCIDEEELDKDKIFDAFISYSHHDRDFALRVADELENGNPSFNLCIHERDFLAGQLIAESIMEAMNDSRRTIVILSKNFLESVWGLHELHCAFVKGLSERRRHLIIIIYGDIGDIDSLDKTIQSYLRTRTYIEWGEAWFWEKLRYALPHRNRTPNQQTVPTSATTEF